MIDAVKTELMTSRKPIKKRLRKDPASGHIKKVDFRWGVLQVFDAFTRRTVNFLPGYRKKAGIRNPPTV